MASIESKTIEQKIDKNKDHNADYLEIRNFLLEDENQSENIQELWNYLNNLPDRGYDEIRQNLEYIMTDPEILKIFDWIWQKVEKNENLTDDELSILYISAVLNWRWTWFTNIWKFDLKLPIEKICNWQLLAYVQKRYNNSNYNPNKGKENNWPRVENLWWQNQYRNPNVPTIKKADESEKMDNYLLSEEDFKKYFECDTFRQDNLWNCWVVAALDSISHLSNYEYLIRSSVKKTSSWFEIRLPMWAPSDYPKAKRYKTKLQDLSRPQLWLNGKQLSLWHEFNDGQWTWFRCLIHALWQMITGKQEFNYAMLTYWPTGSLVPFECFVYWLAGETYFKPCMKVREENNLLLKVNLFTNDEWVYPGEGRLLQILNNFDPGKQSMTVIVNTTDDDPPQIRDDVEAWIWQFQYLPDHVVSVSYVRKTSSWLMIWLSEPHTANKTTEYPYEKFIKMIWWYTIARFDENAYKQGWALSMFQKYWSNHLGLGAWDNHGNYTLHDQVEDLYTDIGDVIVWDSRTRSDNGKNNDIEIEWCWEKVQIVDKGSCVKMTFPWKSSSLEIDNNCFVYFPDGKKDKEGNLVEDYYHWSACKTALFIEKMVKQYIKSKKWKTEKPFALIGNKLVFNLNKIKTVSGVVNDAGDYITSVTSPAVDKVEQWLNNIGLGWLVDAYNTVWHYASQVRETAYQWLELVNNSIDSYVDILNIKSWDNIWLNYSNETWQKIVNFLNQLYAEYNQ